MKILKSFLIIAVLIFVVVLASKGVRQDVCSEWNFIYTPSQQREYLRRCGGQILECVNAQCPQYFSMNVDKDDSSSETAVVVPLGTNHGAGAIWIIAEEKIIFKSPILANIWVDPVEDSDGFVLSYQPDVNSRDTRHVRFLYRGGKFVSQGETLPEDQTIIQ